MEIFAHCIVVCFREAGYRVIDIRYSVLETTLRLIHAVLRDVTCIERKLQYVLIQFKFVLT